MSFQLCLTHSKFCVSLPVIVHQGLCPIFFLLNWDFYGIFVFLSFCNPMDCFRPHIYPKYPNFIFWSNLTQHVHSQESWEALKSCGERESTWRTERGSETPPLCAQSPIAFIMVVTLFHGHCFTDSKMAPAWAVSPHIGITVMLGVRCCHSRAESDPLGTAGSLVLVGSNQCCRESLSVKREQNLFLLFHLSQRAATFLKADI